MKKIRTYLKRTKKQRRIGYLLLLTSFVVWYCNCLPENLFDSPVSLVLEDRNGELLSAHVAKDDQWRFPYNEHVNTKFKQSLITFEDKRFESHFGVDFLSVGRAILSNISKGRVVSGASTISMQVIRLSRNNPKRTFAEKIAEMFRATRLEMRYTKDEILALHASHAPFGGNVIGLDAASWKYFGKSQDKLTWSEAAMLAVLPNAPSLIHPGKNRELLLAKRDRLLDKLYKEHHIDSTTCVLSKLEALPPKPLNIPSKTPHLMNDYLVKNKSGKLKTTIDIHLQQAVTNIIKKHGRQLSAKAIHNASALVIETKTGQVISYVGNTTSSNNNYGGKVDMIHSKRSTGSILKPILYAEMLDQGKILKESIIPDIPISYQGYSPKNYNLTHDGVVPANKMVSKSLNIPAVNMLRAYGVNNFTVKLQSYGFSSINKSGNHYGLPLILGGAEVTPWELGVVYAGLVQKLKGYNRQVSVLNQDSTIHPFINNYPNNMAIYQMFEAMLEVTRPNENKSWKVFENVNRIAWKTGTSFGGRDAWAVGCSPSYVVVIWAGNSSGEGRSDLTGFRTASPILFDVFNALPQDYAWFTTPKDNLEKLVVCSRSGYKANENCEDTRKEIVCAKGVDSKPCSYCKLIPLDSTGNYNVEAGDYSPMYRKEKTYFVLNPIEATYYKKDHADYKEIPPALGKTGNFKVVYPKKNAKIYLPRVEKDNRSKIVVKAIANESNDQLFWILDEQFIGLTDEKSSIKYSANSRRAYTISS